MRSRSKIKISLETNILLNISPQDEDEHEHEHELQLQQQQQQQQQQVTLVPYSGERALQSAGMAKKVRDFRSNRGRLVLNDGDDDGDDDYDDDYDDNESCNATASTLPSTSTSTTNTTTSTTSNTNTSSTTISTTISTTTTETNTITAKRRLLKLKPLPKQRIARSNINAIIFSYDAVLQVLRAYHTLHNDLILPRRFIVPSTNDYPIEWHDIDLSTLIYNMKWWSRHVKQRPERVAELNALGFCWERLQPEWNLILEALITYSSRYGHLLVPVSFVVPSSDDNNNNNNNSIINECWPKATWGIALGKCVHRMRLRHDFLKGPKGATRRSQLDGLGFVWDVSDLRFAKFCAALKQYNTMILQQASTRYYRTNPNDWDLPTSLKIPSTFVVPSDETWPRGLWKYPLGAKCAAVRQKGLYVKGDVERQQQLATLGFSWNGNAARGWYQVVHAAAIYSQLHSRNLNVPIAFVVPEPPQIHSHDVFYVEEADAWPWPQHLWGFPLGQRLKDVRLKGAYLRGKDAAKRRAQLDNLGFNWNPKRGRRKRD